ncbi:uncharacterized protein LOC117547404 isoform X3 [Gymnodraco acuticeps]|uniref:Uncharacterized protein LOC117547404 isoform X3 n=1 Tax=Gymnodraco acuticeps TaxID=8218 RepID=A0A6P8UPM4_GYMAC|nr:uncharacterized protein LOC117547404 isoform X3 [Gymnodraco acuticeps]XP_034074036.1 uncharacterized protein LOC117547404 isoform X3 [Gymnodraco acuticeps]XP_034074037.1 uncharacterized protein LOC117547404 isoform X3 [Gymnodraco acuticeps]
MFFTFWHCNIDPLNSICGSDSGVNTPWYINLMCCVYHLQLVQANKWAAHPSQDPSSTWLLTWLRFIQSTENHDGPALQVDSGPPARPQPAPPHPAQDPSPPLPEWLLTWLPRPSPPVPEEGWSLVPCAHPTRIVLQWPQRSGSSPRPEPPREPLPVRKVPEQQWMKSARLLMKKRSQVGSRWRKRGAEAAEGRKEAKRRGGGRQN